MKKIFRVLPIVDFITSFYWLLSSIFFNTAEQIKNSKISCSIFSIVFVSLLSFEFCFVNCMLAHFRKINFNPIEGILKPNKSFRQYLIICTSIGIIIGLLSFFLGTLGKSPMVSCFINTELSPYSIYILLFPLLCIGIAIYQIINGLFFSKMFENDSKIRNLYLKNSIYALIFCILYLPMLVLLLITFFNNENIDETASFMTGFSYFCSVFSCLIPSIMAFVRQFQGIIKFRCLENKFKELKVEPKKKEDYSKNFSRDLTLSLTGGDDQFDWLDRHAMEYFMRDILLGIATCIQKSAKYGKKISLGLSDPTNFTKHEINFENLEIDDEQTKKSEYLDINIIEYAPKCFAYLRKLEGINIKNMVRSFLPKNNKNGLKESQGKSGSFFISTDDNKYMVKTLKIDEFELIRHTFLDKYIKYLSKHPNSLMCRLYGMYNLTMCKGTEIYIIVMRNVIGDFKDNIVAKFDLKGSTTNREIKGLTMEKFDREVLKDNNFNEIEYGIMLNKSNIERLRNTIKQDSIFLSGLDLMDYSLFVVKLTLSKEESVDAFGEGIDERQEKDFIDILNTQTVDPSEIEENMNINENIPTGKGKLHEIKFYRKYLFPSINKGVGYIISIIDYFQYFNFYKYVEAGSKTIFQGKRKRESTTGGVSCVNPKLYSQRFINYVNDLTEINHILTKNKEGDTPNDEK